MGFQVSIDTWAQAVEYMLERDKRSHVDMEAESVEAAFRAAGFEMTCVIIIPCNGLICLEIN